MKISQWEFNEQKNLPNSNGNDSDIIIPLQNHKNL
jgi:hypothetical protein